MATSDTPRPSLLPLITGIALAVLVIAIALDAYRAWQDRPVLGPRTGRPVGQLTPPAQPAPPPQPEGEALPYGQIVQRRAPVVAPAIDLPGLDGKRFSLVSARGQVVFLNFWATWCPPCAKEMPSMLRLGQELSSRYPGKFRMVAVSVDESFDLVKTFFAKGKNGGLPRDITVVLDKEVGDVTRSYYCQGRGACSASDVKFPESYIVDQRGQIVSFVVGDRDWANPAAKAYLEQLIRGG